MRLGFRLSSFYLLTAKLTGETTEHLPPPQKPLNICFWFSTCADVFLHFFSSSPVFHFQHGCTEPQECWICLCLTEIEEQAAKPHNPNRGENSWLDTHSRDLALRSFALIIFEKLILDLWSRYSVVRGWHSFTESETINHRYKHVKCLWRTINSGLIQAGFTSPTHTNTCRTVYT